MALRRMILTVKICMIASLGFGLMLAGPGMAGTLMPTGPVILMSGPKPLQDLIDEALANNRLFQGMDAGIESLREASVSAGSLADPRVGLALLNVSAVSLNFKQEPMTQKQVFIAQKFPWPGKLELKSRLGMVEAEKQKNRLWEEKLKTVRKMSNLYYGLGFIDQALILNERLDGMMAQLINVAATRYASGRGSRQDVLQAQVERLKLTDERVNLQKKYRTQENGIHALLNSAEYAPVPPPEVPDFHGMESRVLELVKKARGENAGLGVLAADVKKNHVKLALAEKDYYPDIDVKLSYGQRDQDRTGRDLDDFISLAATINLSVWKKRKQDRNVLSVKAGEASAAHMLSALRLEIPHRAEALAVEIIESLKRVELYRREIIPESRQWAESALNDYEVGKIEFASMIRANILPLRMELEEKRVLFDLFKKQAQLEEFAGGAL